MSKSRKSAFTNTSAPAPRPSAPATPAPASAPAEADGQPRREMERANREGIVPGLRSVQSILQLPIAEIDLNPHNPRRYPPGLSDAEIDALLGIPELANSIKEHGLLQPPVVIPNPGDGAPYVILAGERRFRALRRLGLETIPCLPSRPAETEAKGKLKMVSENTQRRGFSPMQMAQAANEFRGYDEQWNPLDTPQSWNAAEARVRALLAITSYEYLGLRRLAQLPPDAQAALLLHDQTSAGVWYERLRGYDLETPEGQAQALQVVLDWIRTDQAALRSQPSAAETGDAVDHASSHPSGESPVPARRGRQTKHDTSGARMIALFRHATETPAIGRPAFEVTVRVKREQPATRSETKRRAEQAAVLQAAINILQEQLQSLG